MAHQLQLNGKFPAWKGEGVYEGHFENALVGLQAAKRDYQSATVELYAKLPPLTPGGQPVMEKIPDRALYRGRMEDDPERRYITTVSERFQPVQHSHVAQALLTVPTDWPLCMLGSTGKHNTRVFWGFDAGTKDLLGLSNEQVQQYIYISSANDGGSSIHMMGATVRMSCLNMVPMVTKNASFNIRMRHGAAALTDVQQWVKYFHRVQEGFNNEFETLTRMATTEMVREVMQHVAEQVYEAPMPKLVQEHGVNPRPGLPDQVRRAQEQYQNLLERTQIYRVSAVEEYDKICDESPKIAGTAYAAFNSITFLENWRNVGRQGSDTVESIMYGDRSRTIQKAREVILAAI